MPGELFKNSSKKLEFFKKFYFDESAIDLRKSLFREAFENLEKKER